MGEIRLRDEERHAAAGGEGEAIALAWRLLLALGEAQGARDFVPIVGAHVDGCLYHGIAGLDFARRLVELETRVTVPTTLNVGYLDLLHPDRFRGSAEVARSARELMDAYVSLGCEPTWTCAPYQREVRPSPGDQVAWAESNAIVFANSVLGAWTERYGDFTDICAGLTGRVPRVGLHTRQGRRARVQVELGHLPPDLLREDVFYPVLGHWLGGAVGSLVPALSGLPATVSEDRLKALGAAGASSGALALFHAVGITPEAPDLETAFQGTEPEARLSPSLGELRHARDQLSTRPGGGLEAVALGTPHFSRREFGELLHRLRDSPASPTIPIHVSTSREILEILERDGWREELQRFGVVLLVDTCSYVTPLLDVPTDGLVMTNSAKWAYYAPGNLGVEVAFGSLSECVRSACEGRVVRDAGIWGG